jgi:hypothetical protein
MHVERMSPDNGVTLPRNGTAYIEIAYKSDRPLLFQAEGFAGNRSTDAGQSMNGSTVHPAGEGTALVWVSFRQPVSIDEIRVTAYDEQWRPVSVLAIAGPFQWLAQPAAASESAPGWVQSARDDDRRLARAYQASRPPPADPIGDLMTLLVFVSVPGYFLLQGVSMFTQRGHWLWASLVPLIVMVPAAGHAAWALSAGSNLWPLIFIFASPIGFVYLVGVFVLRWARGRILA